MEKDNTLIFDKYIQGRLSHEEQLSFEQDLAKDPQLKQAFQMHKIASEAIELEIANTLRTKMASGWTEKKQKSWFKITGIAASLMLLAGLFYTLRFTDNNMHNELNREIAGIIIDDDNFRGDSNSNNIIDSASLISAADSIQLIQEKGLLKQAKMSLMQKDYVMADSILRQLTSAPTKDPEVGQSAEYFLCLSLIGLDKDTESYKSKFTEISNNPNHLYKTKATYWLSLIK